MLKKLLPWTKKSQPQDQEQKDPNQKENQQEPHQNPANPLNESPSQTPVNLIGRGDVYSESDIYVFKFSNIFPIITLTVYSIFIALVLYNFYLNLNLSLLKSRQVNLMQSISNYGTELEVGREVEEKGKIYRSVLASRVDFKVKMNTLLKTLPDEMHVNQFEIEDDGFEIELEGKNILLFARLITLYLGSNEVQQISIESAIKNSGDDAFTVVLAGKFDVPEKEQTN